MFLRFVKLTLSSTLTNIPPTEVLRTIVNQELQVDKKGWSGTALHYAVRNDNVEAASVLLKNGAVIDKPDSKGRTALMSSLKREMIMLLVSHGASPVDHFAVDIFDWLDWELDTFTSVISAYSGNARQESITKLPAFLPTTCDTRGSFLCEELEIFPVHLFKILEAKVDLNRELGSEISLMHLAIVNQASSTFVLNSDIKLEDTTPFPWHLKFWSSLSFMESTFRLFRKRLKDKDLIRICHLQPSRGWSPLCMAAIDHNIEMVRNCLSLAADVDFEGSTHGSALILACASGYLEVVRILVRAGASLSYTGQTGHRSVFAFCHSKEVRRWLLVERFTEQRLIDEHPHWEAVQTVRPWAGTAMARLKLVGERAMCYHETSVDYAGKLARMRKEWRGKVIPTVCMEGIVYR